MTDIYDDLVARLYAAGDLEAADEIENLRGEITFLFHSIEAHQKEIERFREALQKIAAVEDEKLPVVLTESEAVYWSILDACVGLARKALEWK